MAELIDKYALAFGFTAPPTTDPPVETKPVEPPSAPNAGPTAPAEAPTPDPAPRAPDPAPPAGGLPGAGEPNPVDQARRLLRVAEDTGDTDELARFLRELRNTSGMTVARGVINTLYNDVKADCSSGRISNDLAAKLSGVFGDVLGIRPSTA